MSCPPTLQQGVYQASLKAKEMLGLRLLVLHNLYFYNTMMEEIREAIETGTFSEYKKNKLARMEAGLDE